MPRIRPDRRQGRRPQKGRPGRASRPGRRRHRSSPSPASPSKGTAISPASRCWRSPASSPAKRPARPISRPPATAWSPVGRSKASPTATPPTRKANGMAATLELDEVEQVYPVDFQDLHVSSLDLDAYLSAKDPLYSREKLPATHPVLQRYTKWVQEFLDSKGVEREDCRHGPARADRRRLQYRLPARQAAPDSRPGDLRRQSGDPAGQAPGGHRRRASARRTRRIPSARRSIRWSGRCTRIRAM